MAEHWPESSEVDEAEPRALLRRFAHELAPRRAVYWADLLLSAGIGWTLFALSLRAPFGSVLYLLATLGSVFALLRGLLFIHELAHLKPGQVPGFELAWNLILGIPALVPSLMYVGPHMDHHRSGGFSTSGDPEYAPVAYWRRWRILGFVAGVAVVPPLLPIRWGVLGPVSRLFPALRPLVVGRMSTLAINFDYRRPLPRGRQLRRWAWQEALAAAFVWAVAAGALAGIVPLAAVAQWVLVVAAVGVINQLRTLAAHGYANRGHAVVAEAQLLDSITLRGRAVPTALLAPVGLRYHALHHHLPGLPYHSLGKIHRCLMQELPADAPYRETLRSGVFEALRELWKAAGGERSARGVSGSRVSTGP